MSKNNINNIENSGFKVPEDYFNSFDDRLTNKLNEKQLSDIKTPGFKIPDDYFTSLEDKIMQRAESKQIPTIKLRTKNRLYYIAGIAASLILIAAIFLNRNTDTSISIEMVETYFENSSLDSYELAELLSEADLLDDDFKLIETEFNEENLESYLLNHADIENIIE